MISAKDKYYLRLIDIELFHYLLVNKGYKGCLSNLARELGLFSISEIVKFRYRIIRLYKLGYIMIALKRNWQTEIVLLDKGKEILQALKVFNPINLSDKVLQEIDNIKRALGLTENDK